jgi:hypothetical protein
MRNAYKTVAKNPDSQRSYARPKCRWLNIKIGV